MAFRRRPSSVPAFRWRSYCLGVVPLAGLAYLSSDWCRGLLPSFCRAGHAAVRNRHASSFHRVGATANAAGDNLLVVQSAVIPQVDSEFARFKADVLDRTLINDKSPKGSVDARCVDLLQLLNGREQYVTTSSCSGKVLFMSYLPAGGVADALPGKRAITGAHLRASHDGISDVDEFFSVTSEPLRKPYEEGHDIWLKVEPLVLEIVCASAEDALRILSIAKPIFNREAVVISPTPEWRVAVRGSQRLEMPYAFGGHKVYTGSLATLAEVVNGKLAKNWASLDRFLEALRRGL